MPDLEPSRLPDEAPSRPVRLARTGVNSGPNDQRQATSHGDTTNVAGLRRQVGGAMTWAVLGQVAKRGATFLTGLVLARILTPEHFGVYTIALTVAMFAMAFNDAGIGYAIARHRSDDVDELAATAATLAVSLSVGIYLALFAAAPWIVSLFDRSGVSAQAGAVGVVRLLGLTIVIDGAIAASAGAITRELDERTRTMAELAGFALSIIVNLTLALGGAGPWALAVGQVAGSLVTALWLVLRSPVRARFGWQSWRARELLRFGLPMIVAGTLNQLVLNSDYVVVNRYLGAAVTGAYFLAFNVSNWPVTLISFAMRRAAVTGFSRLAQDRAELERAFVSSVGLLVTLVAPMVLLVGLLATDVLRVLYGPRYVIGTTALEFLAGIALLRLVTSLGVDLLTALGRTLHILWVQASWFVTLVPAMAWGARHHGLVGVGVAQAAVAGVVALPLLLWQLAKAGVSPLRLMRVLPRPLLGAVALTIAVVATKETLLAPAARLIVGGVLGLAAYLAVVAPGTPLFAKAVVIARGRLRPS